MTLALDELAALVYRESGIRFTQRQHVQLRAALDRLGTGLEPEAFLRRASDPLHRAWLLTRLIEEVTIQETYFLRDRGQLMGLDWKRLLDIARAGGADHVRVWVAACATGEEAYSLALLAAEAFAPQQPPVTIVATDISADALARARTGSYRARSVRELDRAMRTRYFRAERDGLVVGDQLRSIVRFERHNLVRDPFPPLGEAPFHLILCRNVLIYFDGETVGRVLESFESALTSSGALVLGVADALCATASRLAETAAGTGAPQGLSRPSRQALRRPLRRLPGEPIADDTLDAAAHFRRGVAELENDPAAAVKLLRMALYAQPRFGLAAFMLGGAHEALGDRAAARRAYSQALRALEPDERHEPFLAQVSLADVATAAQTRLNALAARPS